jgi:hypothetical protein
MCTGVEPWVVAAISAATTAAGTAAQMSAAKKQRNARETAALQDMQRKSKTSNEANQLFQAEMENSKSADAKEDVDKAAEQQLAEAQALSQRGEGETGFKAPGSDAAMASATPIVKEVAARQLGDELAKAEGQMKARATLQGFRQRQIKRGTQFGRATEQMKNLGNFNQGWSQVAQTQQELAKNAGANTAMLGDVLVGAGSIGQSYAGVMPATSAAGSASTLAGSTPYATTGASSLPSTVGTGFNTNYNPRAPTRFGGYFR